MSDDSTNNPTNDPAESEASADVSAPTRITIKTDEPLALVAYRDFDDPVWHAAEQKAPNRFVAKVHGPYWVTSVCVSDVDFGNGVTAHNIDIRRTGRVLGDGAELKPGSCVKPGPVTRDISGQMAQAGRILVGDNFDSSPTDHWTFQIPVLKGTYTLYASTADRIVIRRGIQAQRSVVIAPIDASVEGNPLAPASFAIANPDGGAQRAIVRIEQQAGTFPGRIFLGAPTAAVAVPSDVLTADDNQTVSLQSVTDFAIPGGTREQLLASRRPWRIGDDPTFTLPPQIAGGFWTFDGNDDEVVHWATLPAFSIFSADLIGNGVDPLDLISDSIDISPAFAVHAFPFDVTFDTQIPGFSPDWRVDRSLGYSRDINAQLFSDPVAAEHGQIDSSTISETIDATPSLAPAARRAATERPARIAP